MFGLDVRSIGTFATVLSVFFVPLMIILLPFHVHRIRNEAVKANKNLEILIELLRDRQPGR